MAGEIPERRSVRIPDKGEVRGPWCKVVVTVSLVPPKPGQLISVARGPFSTRVTVCLPRFVLASAALGLAGTHPWFWKAVAWVRAAGGF